MYQVRLRIVSYTEYSIDISNGASSTRFPSKAPINFACLVTRVVLDVKALLRSSLCFKKVKTIPCTAIC